MDKFEKQFEDLDVQSAAMDNAMSNTTTLTVPQVIQ
jgi:charged multivesicular body protein 1